jgi:type I restriction enzyme S subunit
MTSPFDGRSSYPLVALGYSVDTQLGKMLQTEASSPNDVEVPYLRAGSLADLDRLDELPTMYASPREATLYSVRPGDLLVSEGGDVGRAEFAPEGTKGAIMQNSLHRLRARDGDIRFIGYALSAIYSSGWLDVLCNRATFGHLTVEKLRALKIPFPDPNVQRTIADCLDAETARIDALIEKKRRMMELLEERASLALQASMRKYGFTFPKELDAPWDQITLPEGWSVLHLNQTLLQLTNGFVGPTRDILYDDGIKYVQSLHIKNGVIDFERRPFYVAKEWHDARPRVHLRPEDVLIVQTGDIGQVAVVPPDFGQASCHALQIARVRQTAVSGSYLGEYLRTPYAYQSLLKRATGALHPHLEGGIRDVPVVVPPRSIQKALVKESRSRRSEADRLRHILGNQTSLIVEHRQALIVAAITGQLDISLLAA